MCPLMAINDGKVLPGHVLAIETANHGLVLVDTGFGLATRHDPKANLGGAFAKLVRAPKDAAGAAITQLQKLGFESKDVRHILITHLDLDHAGGLADFRDATVHVHADELAAARNPTAREKSRYRSVQWSHNPRWKTFSTSGERWNGFARAQQLEGLPTEFIALPLHGHTRGHAAFAIDTGSEVLVHAGDAYFHRGSVRPSEGPVTKMSKVFEGLNAVDRKAVAANHQQLAALAAQPGGPTTVFCAHDPVELARLQGRTTV
jgi:glyoxylase-like metal-dependent hydrolase (beta-lactamase superfamily II)